MDELNIVQTVHIVTTGGTIDKSYDEYDGTLENRESVIRKEIIDGLRLPYKKLEFHPLMSKDSLHLTDQDREIIIMTVRRLMELNEPIVILHGTDTMTVTAELLNNTVTNIRVPIIFTGAMRPIGFTDTDALQNLTEAIYATTMSLPGVYISFHSRLFAVPGVAKNRTTRTFERVEKTITR